jgi:hypothetical protein
MKNLWICWFQGYDELVKRPRLRSCVLRWKRLNPDWNIVFLDEANIPDYVPDFPGLLRSCKFPREYAAKSDLLRLHLLYHWGGVWADTSLYPITPLSKVIPSIINSTGFFTFRFIPRKVVGQGIRETVTWFLAVDRPKHPLISAWKDEFTKQFLGRKNFHYYQCHRALCTLYDTDPSIRDTVDSMVQISEAAPHSLASNLNKRSNSFVYKRPTPENFRILLREEYEHSPRLMAEVALEAIRATKTREEIAAQYSVHPDQVQMWQRMLIKSSEAVFIEANSHLSQQP